MYEGFRNKTIPVNAYLEPTLRCNLQCVHCYVEKVIPAAHEELTRAEIDRVLDGLAGLGALIAVVTGGEPFLRSDIMEILGDIRRHNFALVLFTNGTLMSPSHIEALAELAPLSIEISLHGATAELHDRVVGRPGSFDRAVGNIKLLRAHGVSVKIKCMLMNANRGRYEELIKLSETLDASILFDYRMHPSRDSGRGPMVQMLDDDAIAEIHRDPVLNQPRSDGGVDEHCDHQEQPLCGAARHVVCVSSDGGVYPCVPLRIKGGNVRNASIEEIWNHSRSFSELRALRRADLTHCRDCELSPTCGRCMASAYAETGDLRGCSPVSRRIARLRAATPEECDAASVAS